MLKSKWLVISAIVLLLAFPVLAFEPLIGYMPKGESGKILKLDIAVTENKSMVFDVNIPESCEIVSVKMSGKIVGRGEVLAFLKGDSQFMKIFSHNQKSMYGMRMITASLIAIENVLTGAAVSGNDTISETVFKSECIDTCSINMGENKKMEVAFIVEPGTTLNLESIEYNYMPLPNGEECFFARILSKILNIFR